MTLSRSKNVFLCYITEMKPLESHPMFNPAIKVKDAPKEEKKPVAVTDGKEDLNFNLFEQTDEPPAAPAEKSTTNTLVWTARIIIFHHNNDL